jgi:hypothetical protein
MYDVSYVSDLTKGKNKELNWIELFKLARFLTALHLTSPLGFMFILNMGPPITLQLLQNKSGITFGIT